MNIPKTRKTFCAGKKCRKHTVHKVTQYKTGKASLCAQGKRRYDRKQSGFGGQTKPVFKKKVWPCASLLMQVDILLLYYETVYTVHYVGWVELWFYSTTLFMFSICFCVQCGTCYFCFSVGYVKGSVFILLLLLFSSIAHILRFIILNFQCATKQKKTRIALLGKDYKEDCSPS